MTYLIDNRMRSMLIWIPARGGSKGVRRKAMRSICGKPVIAYTIESALSVQGADRIIVNTDDSEICETARLFGAEVPFLRPSELAQDGSDLRDVLLHQSAWFREKEGFIPEIQVVMSPTHPFRRRSLIESSLRLAQRDATISNIRSVYEIGELIDNCWLKQGADKVAFFSNDLENVCPGKFYENKFSFNIVLDYRKPTGVKPYPLNDIESIDIDDEIDLQMARIVVREGLYPFPED
jgi:CMP-N,N'-diacetyllegionaminic acid synthase